MDRYLLKQTFKNRYSLNSDPKPCKINFSFYIEFSGPWIRLQGTEGLGDVIYTVSKNLNEAVIHFLGFQVLLLSWKRVLIYPQLYSL